MVNNGMDNAWPYTLEWRAYYHAVVHHRNGESFSGDPFLDPVYDAQVGFSRVCLVSLQT